MTARNAVPLLTALANVPDSRNSQRRRHPSSALLALAVAAVVSGAESVTAISQWGREQRVPLLPRLGFTHWREPCVATLHRIFHDLDVTALETVLTHWWQSWLPVGGGIQQQEEIGAASALLSQFDLTGWIVTDDAKFTQKRLAEQIVTAGGDYVMIVKDNQPTLRADIATLCSQLAVVADTVTRRRVVPVTAIASNAGV